MNITIHRLAKPFIPFVNALFTDSIEGVANLPPAGPYILASNHESMPDSWVMANIVLASQNIRVWFIARDNFWFTIWWGHLVGPLLGSLLIDWRSPSAVLEKAKAILRSGEIVGIFPEGTRNPDKRSLVLGKTGVARLALAAHCPVVPVGYIGLPINSAWDVFKIYVWQRQRSKVRIGQPIDLSAFYGKPITKELLYEVTDKIMIEIGKLCGKKPRLHK